MPSIVALIASVKVILHVSLQVCIHHAQRRVNLWLHAWSLIIMSPSTEEPPGAPTWDGISLTIPNSWADNDTKLVQICNEVDLCQLSLSSLTSLVSFPSFDEVPPFTPRSAPRIYTAVLDGPTLITHVPHAKAISQEPEELLVSVPTGPRLRAMLMEPIHVEKWLVGEFLTLVSSVLTFSI